MKKVSKKISLIGFFGVGKTSIIRKFVHNKFSEDYISTIGVKVDKKLVQIGENQLNMLIWDIEGESTFSKIKPAYLAGSSGFFYVFDISRPATYENLESELNEIKAKFPESAIVVVANKVDLINEEEKASFQEKFGDLVHYFSSAMTGENVEDAFITLGKDLLN